MYQFNLYNNDIIIILVLFSVFCVFLYLSNIKDKSEHFETKLFLVNSNENKQNIKQSFEHCFGLFEKHIIKLNDINNQNINIINKFNTNNNININTNINNINNFLNLITINHIFDEKLSINIEFNSLFTNINELFNTHKKLFNNPNYKIKYRNWEWSNDKNKKWIDSDSEDLPTTTSLTPTTTSLTPTTTSLAPTTTSLAPTTTSLTPPTTEPFYGGPSNDSDLCYKLNLHQTDPISFYYNLSNQIDVIETKNISQLKLIKINIDNIKLQIKDLNNTLSLDPKISSDINNAFDNYYNLLDMMYNKDSVNIYNIIYEHINKYDECETENTYDKYKLEDIKININDINLKTFKKLNGDFKYYDLDKIFLRDYKPNDHFKETKAGINLWQTFCEKLKKLNKPNKQNLILKKFNLDLIEKKKKFIKELEDKIYNIQDNMTYEKLEAYNINKLRTHEQAKKQYEAIKKGIDNIKNKNKLKINLI